jgi:hypothetical protein
MLHLYVLYACMHLIAGKHAPRPGKTQCVESRVFFHAEQCKRQLPKGGGLTQKTKYARSWLECQDTKAASWIPADPNDGASRLYEAEASASDERALAALLAPLSPQARATLEPGGFKRPFQRTFRGPGALSFFIVGTGASVVVYAVSNLDDFQFADIATDVSSASAAMSIEKDLDFPTIADNAGVELSYHTQNSQRAMPPPGGMEVAP